MGEAGIPADESNRSGISARAGTGKGRTSVQLSRRHLLFASLAGMLAPAGRLAPQSAAGSQKHLESGVELVRVTATVTDAGGRVVTDLTSDEFEILEDGAKQPVTQFATARVPGRLPVLARAAR